MHHVSIDEALREFTSSRSGLHRNEVQTRRAEFGSNEIPEKKRSLLLLFFKQFHDVFVYILIAAFVLTMIISFTTSASDGSDTTIEAASIAAILVLNAILGFFQEYKAERAIAALNELSSPTARVRRNDHESLIPSKELVPGDIVIVEAGDRISADGRLITLSHFTVDESTLTGESVSVAKVLHALPENSVLPERTNMVFAGTSVLAGSAEYLVTAIGMATEVGKIADLVARTELPLTPLAIRMANVSKRIGIAVMCLCIGIGVIGILESQPLIDIILLAASLTVSAVPEGLPAVITATLAIGVRRMARRHAIVRRLDALETLGSVTIICSDKTGTITKNHMTVRHAWLPSVHPIDDEQLLITIAASSNRAALPDIGDPMEVALLRHAQERGVERLPIDEEEVPFGPEHKYMRTRHGPHSFLKGAPEKILSMCDDPPNEEVERTAVAMSLKGLRVLACAIHDGSSMRFVGLLALEDPPREGVRDAIEHAAHAGIRTIMLTGDSPETAESIAHDVGIVGDVMHGRKIDTLDDDELFAALGTTSVFARVSPAHKLRILESLRSHGAVVAMTGDGVNDAPALKRADVGIAMGRVGTHVAREAASIVLADDHFATIVKAIAEGRRIYDNIRKFVVYLLRANAGQLLFITSTMLLGLPLPLLPIHILWINLMTDGLPALALGMEPAERDVMQRPPRGAREDIFSGELSRFIIFVCVAAFLPLALFGWDIESGIAIDLARARVFSLSILLELLLAFATRSDRSLFRVGFFGNYWLMLAVLPPIVLHILILSFAPLRAIFHLAPMGSGDVVTVLACGIGSLLALESLKFVYQPSRNHRVLR